MDFIGFNNKIQASGLDLFTLRDVELLYPTANPKTVKNNLANWLGKHYITRLRRGLYARAGADIPDYHLANRLYQPSYVSLEAALSFYNIIPGEAAEVTSVTTKPTRTFRNERGAFTYRTCQPKAYTGYRLIDIQGKQTLIADREKALVDFIHFRLYDGQKRFEDERLNPKALAKTRKARLRAYARAYGDKTAEAVEDAVA
jgi:predicted transcriptional regulator of viral defense system